MSDKNKEPDFEIEKVKVKPVVRTLKPQKEQPDAKTKHYDEYYTTHLSEFKKFNSLGCQTIEILPFLKGKKWDDVALGYIHSVRPSCIRVTKGTIKLDSRLWRVTVYINDNNIIEEINQEVEIGLPDSVRNGEAMKYALKFGIDSAQCQWYNDDKIEGFYLDGINDEYYKILEDGTYVPFPSIKDKNED